jgi:hypothetical protein
MKITVSKFVILTVFFSPDGSENPPGFSREIATNSGISSRKRNEKKRKQALFE